MDCAKAMEPSLARTLQGILDRAVAGDPGLPGVALRVCSPQLGHWTGTAGQADRERKVPMGADHTFRIGSLTKTFTAVAVLQLVQQGRLKLDEPILGLLPAGWGATIPNARTATLRMLLNHSAGIPHFTTEAFFDEARNRPERVWTEAEIVARIASLPAPFPAGAGVAYSNGGFWLLGPILEKATGRPWAEAVRTGILGPLGLTRTGVPEGTAPPDPVLRGYWQDAKGGPLQDLSTLSPSMAGAAGAMVSTTVDLVAFLQALFGGRLLNPDMMAEMQKGIAIVASDPKSAAYGLGLELIPGPVGIIAGKNGAFFGSKVMMERLGDGTILVFQVNAGHVRPDIGGPLLVPLIHALSGAAAKPAARIASGIPLPRDPG
jgi:D-alanyl-D-alanine carboxypeptidase